MGDKQKMPLEKSVYGDILARGENSFALGDKYSLFSNHDSRVLVLLTIEKINGEERKPQEFR